MQTTLTLDDDLPAEARRLSGLQETSAIVQAALRALVEREQTRRLAALGGSDLSAEAASRR